MVAVSVDLEDYFLQKWFPTLSGLCEHQNSMLVDLLGIDSVLCILAYVFFICCDAHYVVLKDS